MAANGSSFIGNLSRALLLLLLLVIPGCEIIAPPQKAPEAAKPEAAKPEAAKPEAAKPREINLKETKLAAIPEEYDKWSGISFSADGSQVFYKARRKDREFIVVASTGGENIGPAYEGVSDASSSSDGRRFAFGGGKGGKQYLVIDNKELKSLSHEEVAPGAFSPDGRLVACDVGGFKEKKWFIVVSDGEKEVYRSQVFPDTYRSPVFSPDGRLLVFELGDDKREIEKKHAKRTVFFVEVSSWKIIKERLYTDCRIGTFSFSPDSSRVVYDMHKEGKNFIVLNDFALHEERTVELPYTLARQFVLSPNGKHIIYHAVKEGKSYIVESPWEAPAQGRESGPYEAIVSPVFIPGSQAAAYHAMKGEKWRIVAGDKEGAKYDDIGETVFSLDGLKIAYPARKGGYQSKIGVIDAEWIMVVSSAGKPAAVKEGPVYDMVVSPVFSPDGRRVAYRARKGPMEKARRFIVIADAVTGKVIKEGRAGDEIWPPVWSADGKVAGYGARIGRELWWKVEALP